MNPLPDITKNARAPRSEMNTIREAMQCSTLEAIFATVHVALTQGIFLTNYVLDLGASNFECGVVEALPFVLQFSFLFSPWLVRRLEARKPVAGFFAFAHRLSWIVLILLLYVDWPREIKNMVMMLTLLFSNACAVIAHNAWFSWMADLVPASIRGSYYGRRNAYLGVTSLVTLYVGSQVLNYCRHNDYGWLGYTLCFSVAIISAIFAARMILLQYEPPPKAIPKFRFDRLLKTVRNKPLLREYMIFYTVWQFSLGIGAAFFGVHMVKVLKMSVAQMGYFSIISSVTALLASRLWGIARDRVGDRAILICSGIFISLHVWIWMPAEQDRLWPAWVVCIVGGFFWGGFNMAAFNWPQTICGDADRQYAFGMIGMFSGPGFVIGSLTGGALTTYLPQVLFRIGDFEVLHFHLVFALSAIGRGIAILMISRWSRPFDRNQRSFFQCVRDPLTALVEQP